jgi:hypothetical protein
MRWSAALLALVLMSCGDRAPSRAPDIIGQITRATTSVVDGSRRITILVEAVPNDLSGSAKALVTVDRSTRIFHKNANVSPAVEDLLPGTTISVWFDGPGGRVISRTGKSRDAPHHDERGLSTCGATSLKDPLTHA